MASKKNLDKQHNERLQIILNELLKDDENKYCADCDAKGPRWSSWNLGLFLCIRCADSWTPQQVSMVQQVGNRRARQMYEANLPDHFRRPQTDSALEQFIRAKYEHRRYLDSSFVPPVPDVESVKKEMNRVQQMQKRRFTTQPSLALPTKGTTLSRPSPRTLKAVADSRSPKTADLFDLNSPTAPRTSKDVTTTNPPEGNFSDFVSNRTSQPTNPAAPPAENSGSASSDLLGLDFGTPVAAGNTAEPVSTATNHVSTKESILALYAKSPPPQLFATNSTFAAAPPGEPPAYVSSGQMGFSLQDQMYAQQASVAAAPVWQSGLPASTGADPNSFPPWPSSNLPVAASSQWKPSTQQLVFDQQQQLNNFAAEWNTPVATNANISFGNAVPSPMNNPVFQSGMSNAAMAAQQSYLAQVQHQLSAMQLHNTSGGVGQ